MPPNTPDAGPKLLLEDYGNGSQRWLEAYSASGNPAFSGDLARSDDSAPELLLGAQQTRTNLWLRRFSEQQAATPARPAPILTGADAPELKLLPDEAGALSGVWSWFPRANGDRSPVGGKPEIPARSQTAVPRPHPILAPDDQEGLRLTLEEQNSRATALRRRAQAVSLVLHGVAIAILLVQPPFLELPLSEHSGLGNGDSVLLVAPQRVTLAELTQPEAIEGETTGTFEGLPEPVRPEVALPGSDTVPQPDPPPVEPTQPPPAPTIAPPPALEEQPAGAPNQELAAATSPAAGPLRPGRENTPPDELPLTTSPFEPVAEPKLQLENPATGLGQDGPLQLGSLKLNARPDEIIQMAAENLAKTGGKVIVGDGYGAGPGGYLPSSPGNRGSSLELLSDPKGVDFRPYLIQILASVRRNWFAVIPESARLGMSRGRVAIQFIVSRNGTVPKLVIADSSSTQALDHAAVAGISASVPFQPLPVEYTGNEIRLQFVFLYNVKAR